MQARLSLFIVIVTIAYVIGFSTRNQKYKREELSDECQKMVKSPEIDDDTMTRDELVCIFWQIEGSKAKAEEKADQALKDGDDDGNGMIDNGEKF